MIRVRAAVLSILFALMVAQLIPFVQNASGDNSDIRLGFSIDRQVWDMGETINFSASATNAGIDLSLIHI